MNFAAFMFESRHSIAVGVVAAEARFLLRLGKYKQGIIILLYKVELYKVYLHQ